MTDNTWAAKVLEGVPRFQTMSGNMLPEADALAAIAKLAEGDGLVERLTGRARFCRDRGEIKTPELLEEAAAHIVALTAQVADLKREGNPADHALVDKYRRAGTGIFKFPDDVAAIIRKLDEAEAERDALRAKVARLEGAGNERPDAPAHIVEYTNYRGETARRCIIPIRMWWGSTDWHPEEQWMLTAWDLDKNASRDFAWKDMRPVQNPGTSAAIPATDARAEARGKMYDIMCLPRDADLYIAKQWAAEARALIGGAK